MAGTGQRKTAAVPERQACGAGERPKCPHVQREVAVQRHDVYAQRERERLADRRLA
jgi:hypothetical protein